MDRGWGIGKKAGVVGVFLVSLPVLVPCVLVLTFTGALLAVPVGSAVAGFLVFKKLLNARKQLSWYDPEDQPTGTSTAPGIEPTEREGSGELPSSYNVSVEEAPEQCGCPEPSKASDDFIVVEKPSDLNVEASRDDEMGQSKAAPDYFQCVEAEGGDVVCQDKHVEEEKARKGEDVGKPIDPFVEVTHAEVKGGQVEGGKPVEPFVEVRHVEEEKSRKGEEGGKPVDPFVEVTQNGETQPAENGAELGSEADDKDQPVGLSVILEDAADRSTCEEKNLPDQPEEPIKKQEQPSSEGARESGAEKEEPRSSGVYISMSEDFPSSDESVASSEAASTKDGNSRSRTKKSASASGRR